MKKKKIVSPSWNEFDTPVLDEPSILIINSIMYFKSNFMVQPQNTTDLTMKCLLTSPYPTMQFKK